jgi:hypothetical protein
MGAGALVLAPVAALLGYGWLFALLPSVALVGLLAHVHGVRVHRNRGAAAAV